MILSQFGQCLAGRSCKHSGVQDHLQFEMILRSQRVGCESVKNKYKVLSISRNNMYRGEEDGR